nr:hypothetical protein CFP56_05682 [Quercus suber]
MLAYNGQCDWRSNIFILGMIFLTQKKGTLQSARSENWVPYVREILIARGLSIPPFCLVCNATTESNPHSEGLSPSSGRLGFLSPSYPPRLILRLWLWRNRQLEWSWWRWNHSKFQWGLDEGKSNSNDVIIADCKDGLQKIPRVQIQHSCYREANKCADAFTRRDPPLTF